MRTNILGRLRLQWEFVQEARSLAVYVECLLTPRQFTTMFWVGTIIIIAFSVLATISVVLMGFIGFLNEGLMAFCLVGLIFFVIRFAELIEQLIVWHYFVTEHSKRSFKLPVAPAFF